MWPTIAVALVLAQPSPKFALTWNVPCAAAPNPELLNGKEGAATVTVADIGFGWRLVVEFAVPPVGIRRLETATCEDAAEAALLILRMGAAPERRSPPPIETKPPPAPPLTLPATPPSLDVAMSLRVRLSAGGVATVGLLPSASPRVSVAVGFSSGPLAGFLGVRFGGSELFEGGPEGAAFAIAPIFGAQLSGCFLPQMGRVRIGPCVAVTAEWWRLNGVHVVQATSASDAWIGAGIHARLLVDLPYGLFGYVVAGGQIALRRPLVVFEGHGTAYVPSRIAGEGELGLGWGW